MLDTAYRLFQAVVAAIAADATLRARRR